jgi:hypothetical protein
MTLREANAFIAEKHRHHGPARGCLFCLGASDGAAVVAVAIVGRPVSRHLQDGWTAEVVRLASDGSRNACSLLYAGCVASGSSHGVSPARNVHAGRGGRRVAACGRLALPWRSRGRLMVSSVAPSRRHAPDAGEASMGGGDRLCVICTRATGIEGYRRGPARQARGQFAAESGGLRGTRTLDLRIKRPDA